MRASEESEARIPRGGSGSLLSGIVGLQLGRTGARLGIKHGGEASKKSNGFLWVCLVLRHVDDVAENDGPRWAPAVLHGSVGGRTEPTPSLCLSDTDGLRASKLKHAVQDIDSDGDLGCATPIRP
jgi:hypothetical protein